MKILHLSIIIGIVVIAMVSFGVFIEKLNDYQQQPYLDMTINGMKENYTVNDPISFSVTLEGYGTGCGDTMATITRENDSKYQSPGWASQPQCVANPSLHDFKSTALSANTSINQTGHYVLMVSFDDLFEHQKTMKKKFSILPKHTSISDMALSSDTGSANVVVNPNTNLIYVANEVSHTISVIDGNTNTKISDISTNGMPFKMAINPNTNKIYVTEVNTPDNKHNDTILVIDGTNNNKIAEIQSIIFSQLAINQKTNLVYVIGYEKSTGLEQNGTMFVIDGNNNTKIAQLQIGMNPFGITVDPNTNRIYILNKHYTVNSKGENSTVSVLDGRTNTKIADIQVGINPAGIDVNPNTNRIYVSNYGSQTVSVIDGTSNGITGNPILLGPGIEGIAVNPITNRIYVADGLTSTVYVIDGNTDTKIKEIHPLYSWNVGVNPVTSRIYTPSYIFNNISIIDEKSYNITSVIQLGPYPENIK